jgi:hypothetical protein
MSFRISRLCQFIFLVALFSIKSSHAQGIPLSTNALDLSSSSSNPSPGQILIITLKSFTTDINSASINWTVNGKTVQKGTGLSAIQVTAPTLGKKLAIVAYVTTIDGIGLSASLSVGSGSVDLITESDGYVPAFFRGKLAMVYQNSLKIVAMPHIANSAGTEYDPKTLIYQWKKNGSVLQTDSGYGKQSITIAGDIIPREFTITASVTTRDNAGQSSSMMTITPQALLPTTFYVDDPLYGPLLNKAIGEILGIGSQKEVSILAVPYGFNVKGSTASNLTLNWLINGEDHSELASHRSVILRAPETGQGSSNIELSVKSNDNILQGSDSVFTAVFGGSKSSN